MAYLVLSPSQFGVLEAACELSKKIVSYQKIGDYTGIITTHDVTVSYQYDPLRGQLNFEIGEKHSLAAKIAGDNVINNHIVAVIHSLEYPAPPAPTPENPEPQNPAPIVSAPVVATVPPTVVPPVETVPQL